MSTSGSSSEVNSRALLLLLLEEVALEPLLLLCRESTANSCGRNTCVFVGVCSVVMDPSSKHTQIKQHHDHHLEKKHFITPGAYNEKNSKFLRIPSNEFLQMKSFERFSAMKFV
jgi:hypothetical protein